MRKNGGTSPPRIIVYIRITETPDLFLISVLNKLKGIISIPISVSSNFYPVIADVCEKLSALNFYICFD